MIRSTAVFTSQQRKRESTSGKRRKTLFRSAAIFSALMSQKMYRAKRTGMSMASSAEVGTISEVLFTGTSKQINIDKRLPFGRFHRSSKHAAIGLDQAVLNLLKDGFADPRNAINQVCDVICFGFF